jgi:hypothetical protein
LVAGAAIQTERGAAVAAAFCLVGGIWFWLFATGISQVRYFFPFGVMAFITVVPALVRVLQHLPSSLRFAGAAVMVARTAVITVLLLIPEPPTDWQKLLGINLSSRTFLAENEQAAELLNKLRNEEVRSASLFFAEITSAYRSFGSIFSYGTLINPAGPRMSVNWPVSWASATTFRLSDIAKMDYIVVAPIRDEGQLKAALAKRSVPDLPTEQLLIKCWFSSLSPTDGIEIVLENRVRVLRVADRSIFRQALEKLKNNHDWRAEFLAANAAP